MLPDYADIHEAADSYPFWYDGQGVPRFALFEPDMLGVYDKFALLIRIRCQSCHRDFLVGEGWTGYGITYEPISELDGVPTEDAMYKLKVNHFDLAVLSSGFSYGDPPRHDCGGDSMSSENVCIEQAWERVPKERNFPVWVRNPEVESLDIVQDWVGSDNDQELPL